MNKVRVGIVGLGDWGECHLQAYRSLPNAEVVMVCDAREERLKSLAERYGVAEWSAHDADLTDREDIDLISVVTFEKDHLRPALAALESGKHVLVEKPVALEAGEARRMWEAAADNGRYIVPGHVLRFDPRYAQLHSLLRAGEVGELVTLYSKRGRPKRLFETYKRVHTVFESMVHDIDLAIWYADSRVSSVRAYERSVTGAAGSPDVLWACLEFDNGALAVLQSHWMVPDAAGVDVADSAELIGEEGSMSLETVNSGPQLWNASGRQAYELHHHSSADGRATGALRELVSYFCECVSEEEVPSRVPFEDAIHGVEIAEAIKESAKRGREVTP